MLNSSEIMALYSRYLDYFLLILWIQNLNSKYMRRLRCFLNVLGTFIWCYVSRENYDFEKVCLGRYISSRILIFRWVFSPIYLSVYLFVYLFIHLFIYLFIYSFIYSFIFYQLFNLFIYLFIYFFINLFIYLSIYFLFCFRVCCFSSKKMCFYHFHFFSFFLFLM